MFILYILIAILILLVMITIHELGHYIVGKIFKFKIKEFAIGFGPAIFKRKSKKTGEIFSIRVFPLGGYCAFAGEDEEPSKKAEVKELTLENVGEVLKEKEEAAKEQSIPEPKGEDFNAQKPWKRLLVLAGGAVFNIIFGFFMCMIMLWSVGFDIPEVTHVQTGITNNIQRGDVIYKVNNDRISVLTGNNLNKLIGKYNVGETVILTIKRNGEMTTTEVEILRLEYKDAEGKMQAVKDIGIIKLDADLKLKATGQDAYQHGFFEGIGRSFEVGTGICWEVLSTLGKLVVGQADINEMSGPIGTIGQMAELSMIDASLIMVFIPLISLNLGVFNLMPIPALDGGRMVFVIIEWIRKKPIKREIEALVHFVGLIILFGGVILLDILKLF